MTLYRHSASGHWPIKFRQATLAAGIIFSAIVLKAIVLSAILILMPLSQAQAHAPELHQFNLVKFKRSFPAPSFTLPDPNGELKTLESFAGNHVLLNFWATWCVPCLTEMPSMEKLHQKFKDRKFHIVAISSDKEGAAQVKPYLKKLGVTFTILLDTDGRVSENYGARNLPSTFLLNPKGRVVAAAMGERDWFKEGAVTYFDEMLK